MIRSLLVALDDSPGSAVARRMAVDLAVRHGARVQAVTVLDTPFITRAEATPIGGAYYKYHRDLERLRQAHARNEAILRNFRAAIGTAGLDSSVFEAEGDAQAVIGSEAELHDLVVIGRDASFHFEGRQRRVPEVVANLMGEMSRPLLLAPSQDVESDRVLVAYDGSQPSSRALHMFALLGLADGREVRVVTVAQDKNAADERAARAARLLATHGAKPEAAPIVSGRHPAEVVQNEARSMGAGIIVMGAFGHRGLPELLFGSTTRKLVQACPTALFVYR